MKSTVKYFLFFLLFYVSCTTKVEEDQLVYKTGKTYYNSSGKVFSGVLISRFPSGKIASEFTYENGFLKGKWITKGHEGEVIQEGKYIRDEQLTKFLSEQKSVQYYLLSNWKEGDVTFITLDVTTSDLTGSSSNFMIDLLYKDYLQKFKTTYSEVRIFTGDSALIAKKIFALKANSQ